MTANNALDLIDGATGEITELSQQVERRKRIITDKSLPLEERLEAFEDIFDSKVSDTTLARARNIERQVGFRQIYLKFEGGNPTGTQKDRIAFTQAMDALRRGFDAITVATCGNYGVSIALVALKCQIHIPENYRTKRSKEMKELGAEIIPISGDYENAVEHSRQFAEKYEIYDANPGGANTLLQLLAYREIAFEIYDEKPNRIPIYKNIEQVKRTLEQLKIFSELTIGPVKLEPKRVIAPYTLYFEDKYFQTELIYHYVDDVFDNTCQNMADMIAVQVAMNYGLFCEKMKKFKPEPLRNIDQHVYRGIIPGISGARVQYYIQVKDVKNKTMKKPRTLKGCCEFECRQRKISYNESSVLLY